MKRKPALGIDIFLPPKTQSTCLLDRAAGCLRSEERMPAGQAQQELHHLARLDSIE